jgi:hypothetical protein
MMQPVSSLDQHEEQSYDYQSENVPIASLLISYNYHWLALKLQIFFSVMMK